MIDVYVIVLCLAQVSQAVVCVLVLELLEPLQAVALPLRDARIAEGFPMTQDSCPELSTQCMPDSERGHCMMRDEAKFAVLSRVLVGLQTEQVARGIM